jgi:hypothetical protein
MRQVQEFSATRLHVGSEKDHTKPYLLGLVGHDVAKCPVNAPISPNGQRV